MILFLAVQRLRCCVGPPLVVVSEGYSPAAVLMLSCSAAFGTFLDEGLNPCLLHWQVDSLPLSHQESRYSQTPQAMQTAKQGPGLTSQEVSSSPTHLMG